MRKLLLAFCTFLSILISSNIIAQEWEEITKALPIPYDNYYTYDFGSSICIDGDYAIVGAYKYKNLKGCAFVLHFNGTSWETQAKLTFSDTTEWFGYSVSMMGDYAVVGAPYDEGDIPSEYRYRIGAAYVYKKPPTGWKNMTETAKLVASDGESDDLFGNSITISENYIAIGAPHENANGFNSGSVYIFEKPLSGWKDTTETAKLIASEDGYKSYFGYTIDSFEDQIVVGAYNHNDTGSVYIFEKPISGWKDTTETAKLIASDIEGGDDFGCSVSISNNFVAVGATYANGVENSTGSVYVFEKPNEGWKNTSEIAKIMASDGVRGDWFGNNVDVFGNTIVVGAYYDDLIYNNNEGSVYVFKKPESGWVNMTESAKLFASDSETSDNFGRVVSISGDNILISDNIGLNDESIYFYRKPSIGWSSGTEDEQIIPDDKNTDGDNYGFSVSIDEDYAVIGAPEYLNKTGCAYILQFNGKTWETLGRLTASDGGVVDQFGYSVSISGDDVVVGAIGAEDLGEYRNGAAYVFSKPESGWRDMNETAKIVTSDVIGGAFGASLDISNNTIVVGDPNASTYGKHKGALYVFEKPIHGWKDTVETAKLVITADGVTIGRAVSIFNDIIVTGAPTTSDGIYDGGSIYVFEKSTNGWVDTTETAKLYASESRSSGELGKQVSIFENFIVACDPDYGRSSTESAKGAVYIFKKPTEGWKDTAEVAILTRSENVPFQVLGSSIDIYENRIIVGTYDSYYNYYQTVNSVYVFEKKSENWISGTENAIIKSPTGKSEDHFAHALSLSNEHILIGAYTDDFEINENSGSAFFYGQDKLIKVKDKVCEGEEAIFEVVNMDTGSFLQWQEHTDNIWNDIGRETNDTLIIPNVTLGMDGFQYRCIISGTSDDTTDVVTLYVNPIYNETETGSVCIGDSYIFPDGTIQNNITSQVIQVSNLQTVYGCDSIIETTVNVNPIYNLSETVLINSGDSYTFPDGIEQNNITSQVIYTSNLLTELGCDSIIETTVNVEQIQDCIFTEEVSVCSGSGYLFPDGTTQSNITSQVVHESYLPSIYGCDTIIETTVNVNQGDVTYLYETICKGETFQLGYAILSSPGLYGVTLTNQYGCDSLVNLDLEVTELEVELGRDKTIGINDTIVLDAGKNFETYYWNTEETTQAILIDSSYGVGSHMFSVQVTDENDCIAIDNITITISDVTGISLNNDFEGDIKLYPNPTSGMINIDLTEIKEPINISIFDVTGRILLHKELNSNESNFDVEIPGDSGVYFIKWSSGLNSKTYKIIKE